MRFFLKKRFDELFDSYFDADRPFYVFGELAVRGGDYFYGDAHRRKMNTLSYMLYGRPDVRICTSGKSLNEKDAIHVLRHEHHVKYK